MLIITYICNIYASSFVTMLNVIYDSMRGHLPSLQQHMDHDHICLYNYWNKYTASTNLHFAYVYFS